jgi:small redox-active disulfide protein 2
MEIKILGKGCPRCDELEKRVRNGLAELNISAEIQKIKDVSSIAALGVFVTPGLIINGRIKSSGRIPSEKEIQSWIDSENKS